MSIKTLKTKTSPLKISTSEEIYFKITIFARKAFCFFGFHSWALQSGLPGTSKYLCRRCLKNSKEVWPQLPTK